MMQGVSQADRPVWPWLKRKVEARLSFTLYTVVMEVVRGGGAVSVEDVGAEECRHNPIQSFTNMNLIAVSRVGEKEKRLKAERFLQYPKLEMAGPKL